MLLIRCFVLEAYPAATLPADTAVVRTLVPYCFLIFLVSYLYCYIFYDLLFHESSCLFMTSCIVDLVIFWDFVVLLHCGWLCFRE